MIALSRFRRYQYQSCRERLGYSFSFFDRARSKNFMIAKKKEMDPKYARLAGEDAALAVSHADGGFVARLNQIVEAAGGASGLARKAGISPSGLSRYLAGGEPSRRVLVAL